MLRLLFLTSIPRWSNRSRRRSDRRCIPAKKLFYISSCPHFIYLSPCPHFIYLSPYPHFTIYSIPSFQACWTSVQVMWAQTSSPEAISDPAKLFFRSLNSDLKNIILIPGNFQNLKLKSYLIYLP